MRSLISTFTAYAAYAVFCLALVTSVNAQISTSGGDDSSSQQLNQNVTLTPDKNVYVRGQGPTATITLAAGSTPQLLRIEIRELKLGPDSVVSANQSTNALLSLSVEQKTGSRFKTYYARAYVWALNPADGTYNWTYWGDSHTFKFKGTVLIGDVDVNP
jgi:hypothetical protein